MRIWLFIILFAGGTINAFAQEYFNKRFEFYYPLTIDGAMNVLEVEDGYIVNGATGSQIDPNWILQGMNKFDFSGERLWSKIWGDSISRWYTASRGSLLKNWQNYFAMGVKRTYTDDGIHDEILIIKYNCNFDTLWTKSIGEKSIPYDSIHIGRDMIGLVDGFAIAGAHQTPIGSYHDAMLIKTDTLGNVLWKKLFSGPVYEFYEGHSIIATNDGGYAIGARNFNMEYYKKSNPIVIKTDSLGNKQWEVNLGDSWPDGTAIVCNSIDSNIVVASKFAMDSGYNHYYSRVQITKLDLQGNILWNNQYAPKGLSDAFWVSNIRQDSAGGFIISGSTNYSEVWPDEPNGMGYMLRINNDGDSLWYRQYANLWGKFSHNYFYDAIPTSEGGFLGAGMLLPSNQSGDTGNQDAWIIKVDSMGCTSITDCWVGVTEWEWVETENGNRIRVYPNPAHNWFEVEIKTENKNNENLAIEVFDLYGRKVEEVEIPKGKNSLRFYVSDWNRGVYLVRVISGNNVLGSGKLVLR